MSGSTLATAREGYPASTTEVVDLHERLDAAHSKSLFWNCELLFNEAPPDEDEPVHVNLCDFLSPAEKDPSLPRKAGYVFPEHYKGKDDMKKLVVALKICALACGHELKVRDSGKPKSSSHREWTVQLYCQHARLHSDATKYALDSKERQRKTTSSRPTCSSMQCDFRITVFLLPTSHGTYGGRWCLSVAKSSVVDANGVCCHRNHHKFPVKDIHAPLQLMSEDEKRLVKDCSQLYLPRATAAELISIRSTSKLNWKKSQLDYLSSKERQAVHGLSADASSADKLIASFKKR